MRAGAFVLTLAMLALAANALPTQAAGPAVQQGTLAHGGAYFLEPDLGVAQTAVELWFRAPSDGYDATTPGIAQLAAVAVASVPLATGRSLVDFLQTVGGKFDVEVFSDMVQVSAIVPATAARRTIASMTAAYFASSVTDDALRIAQRDAAVLGIERKYSPTMALHDAAFAQLFAAGPAHRSPLPQSDAQIAALSSATVVAFAQRAFRSSNATLVVTGNVDASAVDVVTDGTSGQMDAPYDSSLAPSPQDLSQAGSVNGIAMAWSGPPIADEKAATAMDFINDYLFRDGTGTLQRALEMAGSSSDVNGQFVTLHSPGVMFVTITGKDAEKARADVASAVAALTAPMDAATFAAARQAFVYHTLSQVQTPQAAADSLGWYAAQGNPLYAPGIADGAYLRATLSLDPAYVASIARTYLKAPVVVRLATSPTKGGSPS